MNDKRLSHVPGPNKYDSPIKDRQKAPAWPSSKDERFKGKKVAQPGPGEYEYRDFTSAGPKFSTGIKPHIDPFKMKTAPGPGFYDPEKSKTDIKYSMRKRTTQSMNKLSPGPGAYENDRELYYRTLPGSKIGKDARKTNFFLNTPSYKKQEPGRYEIKGFAGNDATGVPKFSFSKDLRAD